MLSKTMSVAPQQTVSFSHKDGHLNGLIRIRDHPQGGDAYVGCASKLRCIVTKNGMVAWVAWLDYGRPPPLYCLPVKPEAGEEHERLFSNSPNRVPKKSLWAGC